MKTELLSIVECLCGVGLVSKASLVHNFIVFLQPVLVTLVEVFDAFSNCQEVMVVILELFSIIAENYITFLNEVFNTVSVNKYSILPNITGVVTRGH